MVNKYKIANKVVEVTSIYYEVHEYCADYLTDEPADYSVTTTQADINFEREKSAREDEIANIPIRHFSDSYLEELAVYRKIAEKCLTLTRYCFTALLWLWTVWVICSRRKAAQENPRIQSFGESISVNVQSC